MHFQPAFDGLAFASSVAAQRTRHSTSVAGFDRVRSDAVHPPTAHCRTALRDEDFNSATIVFANMTQDGTSWMTGLGY